MPARRSRLHSWRGKVIGALVHRGLKPPGFYFFFGGGVRAILAYGKFDAEISALAPTEVKTKRASLVGDKRQPPPAILANGPVPTLPRIKDLGRVTTGAAKYFIRYTNDIEIQVMGGIAEIPLGHP